MDSAVLCKKSRGLYDRQLNICRREPEVVAEVISGAKKSMEECQRQFQQRRWNCSTQGKAMKRTLKSSKYLVLDRNFLVKIRTHDIRSLLLLCGQYHPWMYFFSEVLLCNHYVYDQVTLFYCTRITGTCIGLYLLQVHDKLDTFKLSPRRVLYTH